MSPSRWGVITAAGIIVFTGMGRDGMRGSEAIARRGGSVWVQAPATCAAVSMPESVLGVLTQAVAGGIDELAEKFNRDYVRAPEAGPVERTEDEPSS